VRDPSAHRSLRRWNAPPNAIEWTQGLTNLDIITLAALVVVVVCVLAALAWAMIEGASQGADRVSFERDPDADGERLIWLAPQVVDRLRVLRRTGESYSDVILRLIELEAEGDRMITTPVMTLETVSGKAPNISHTDHQQPESSWQNLRHVGQANRERPAA
jgi:predicted CopG family antitoxin